MHKKATQKQVRSSFFLRLIDNIWLQNRLLIGAVVRTVANKKKISSRCKLIAISHHSREYASVDDLCMVNSQESVYKMESANRTLKDAQRQRRQHRTSKHYSPSSSFMSVFVRH